MIKFDFSHIKHFTPAEIIGTGAKLSDVCVETILTLDKFRELINRLVCLLPGGLTTGIHTSVWHKRGMAVDFAFEDGVAIDVQKVVCVMLTAGFAGCGVYWNEAAYSFHGDLRPDITLWRGTKKHHGGAWKYGKLIPQGKK